MEHKHQVWKKIFIGWNGMYIVYDFFWGYHHGFLGCSSAVWNSIVRYRSHLGSHGKGDKRNTVDNKQLLCLIPAQVHHTHLRPNFINKDRTGSDICWPWNGTAEVLHVIFPDAAPPAVRGPQTTVWDPLAIAFGAHRLTAPRTWKGRWLIWPIPKSETHSQL